MRRLYYLFPDVTHAEKVVEELLIKRIENRHINAIAKDDLHETNLPEASLFQKSDLRHSLFLGAGIGGVLGVLTAIATSRVLDLPFGGITFVVVTVGIIFGAWAASMIGMTTPNKELRPFQEAIEKGMILLLIDVPKTRVDEIEAMIKKLHPESKFEGEEPTIPSFP